MPAQGVLKEALTTIRQWSEARSTVQAAEIDTINLIMGTAGSTAQPLVAGVVGAIRVDFNALITGSFLYEFDGIVGSVTLDIGKCLYVAGSATPSPVSIVGSAPPTITSGQYAEDLVLTGWTTAINRGELLVFAISTVSSFTRLLYTLRIRRLEP
jgi:hypothetical protein